MYVLLFSYDKDNQIRFIILDAKMNSCAPDEALKPLMKSVIGTAPVADYYKSLELQERIGKLNM